MVEGRGEEAPGESESGAKRRRFAKRKILVISPTMRGGFNEQVPDNKSFPRGIRVSTVVPRCASKRGRFRAGFRETPECPPLDQSRLGIAPNPRRFFFPGSTTSFCARRNASNARTRDPMRDTDVFNHFVRRLREKGYRVS